ncbi:membrane dipeptidase-domain-containing protein, partial [Roridomyces roridus]
MSSESAPLLPQALPTRRDPDKTKGIVSTVVVSVFAVGLVIFLGFPNLLPYALGGPLPSDPTRAALLILDRAPIIDGHIDLPILLRSLVKNNVSAVDLTQPFPGHVDIPRLREGKVGGFFGPVYVGCADPEQEGEDFLTSTWRVRDTLEQIDVALLTIDKYPHVFQHAKSSADIKDAISKGKIASLLGVEGGHQLGNSIAVLRTYHQLGVRYVTLTHTCHNAFADSCGMAPGKAPLHNGLSPLGLSLIDEMNRLGVLVDLSHTSDETARQALLHTKAPVIWSHSSARAVHNHARNVPDDVLALIGTGEGKTDGVVMNPGNATVYTVANHVEHIAKVAGKKHVGLGSDYDGKAFSFVFAELYTRGWSKTELTGLAGGNLLRVFEGAEEVSRHLQRAQTPPTFELYPKRTDMG